MNRSNVKMIDKDVTIERLGFVRELLRIGGFNSKIKANHVKTIDDAIALLKEMPGLLSEVVAVYNMEGGAGSAKEGRVDINQTKMG